MKEKPKVKFTAKRKHNPKSEAAMREAIKNKTRYEWFLAIFSESVQAWWNSELVAEFDLRDCYRKRRPLKGIGKAVSKLVRVGKLERKRGRK